MAETEQKLINKIKELEELLKSKNLITQELEKKISLLQSNQAKSEKNIQKNQPSIKENINNLKNVDQISFPKEHEFKRVDINEIKKGSYMVYLDKSYKVFNIKLPSCSKYPTRRVKFSCCTISQNREDIEICRGNSVYEFKPLKMKCLISSFKYDQIEKKLCIDCVDDQVKTHRLIVPFSNLSIVEQIKSGAIINCNIIGFPIKFSETVFETQFVFDSFD